MAYVYSHERLDTGEIFYIGIGSDDKHDRANFIKGRNRHWENIYNITKIKINIVHDKISWSEACALECKLIKKYGRKDLNEGSLVNLTNGGEGKFGFKTTDYTKNKISMSKTGAKSKFKGMKRSWCMLPHVDKMRTDKLIGKKRNAETRAKMSAAKKGKKLSSEHKQKLSDARAGRFALGKSFSAKIVLNTENGIFYMCAKEASIAHCIKYENLSRYLSGSRKNKTSLIYI